MTWQKTNTNPAGPLVKPGPAEAVIHGFPRYEIAANTLPLLERMLLSNVADTIAESYKPGNYPVVAVHIVGHASMEQRAPGYEDRLSQLRAEEVRRVLRGDVEQRTWSFNPLINAPAGPKASDINWQVSGAGARQPEIAARLGDEAQKRNRRAEIFLRRSATPIAEPSAPPPNILPNWRQMEDIVEEWWRKYVNNRWKTLPPAAKARAVRNLIEEIKERLGLEVDEEQIIETLKFILSSSSHGKEDPTPELMHELRKLEDEMRKRQDIPRRK